MKLRPWLSFFRLPNLVTVPGDVLVGAAAVGLFARPLDRAGLAAVLAAVGASCFLYLFGLADNDLVGVETDVGRPLVTGEISLGAARVARALCLAAAAALVLVLARARASTAMLGAALAAIIAVAILSYNRTKRPWLMGLCRGLNVLWGAAALAGAAATPSAALVPALVPALVWTLYIAAVTKYSEREVTDPTNDRKVQWLVRGLVVLQGVFLICYAVI